MTDRAQTNWTSEKSYVLLKEIMLQAYLDGKFSHYTYIKVMRAFNLEAL